MEREVDVLESGGPPPPRRWRRWQVALLGLVAVLLAGLAVHSALTHPHQAGRGLPAPTRGPTYLPDPVLARVASGALPLYPGTVPPVGYLDAGKRFVGTYAASPGGRVQVDAACAGTGQVLLSAYPDGGPSPTGASQPLGSATLMCATSPNPTTVTFEAPPSGGYQVIFTPSPATGVVAWRLVPWGN